MQHLLRAFSILTITVAIQGCNGAVPGYFKNLPSTPAPGSTTGTSSTSPSPSASAAPSATPSPIATPSPSPTPSPVPTFTVQGTVIDAGTKVAIANANVSITAMGSLVLVTTDNTGTFIATKIKAGTYNIAVSATGYQLYQSSVTISGNSILPAIPLSH